MTAHQNRRFTIVKRQGTPGGPHILTSTTATAAQTTATTATSAPVVTTATTVVVVTATSSSSSSSSSTSSTTSTSSTSTTSTTSASTRSTTSTTPTTTAAPITVAALSTSSLVTTPRPTTSRTASATPTSSPSMSLTPTATPDSGAPIGTIIGVVGAGLVGAIALAAVAGWYFRRTFRKKSDFNKSKFIRHSTAIPDAVDYTHEKVAMGSKNALNLARANTLHDKDINQRGPRPPTIIERRMNATGGAPGADMPSYNPGEVVGGPQGYPDPQAGYPYGGYPQQPYGQAYPAYDYQQQQPGQYYNYAANNVSSAYTPPSEYQQSQLTRRPSGPGAGSPYLQRKASNGVALQQPAPIRHDAGGYTGPEAGDEDFLNMAKHESVTPFQQQQYAEINRQLNAGAGQVTVTDSAGKTSNLEAGDANAAPGRSLATTYSSLGPNKSADPAVASADAKSGTPMDRNPQQNYFQPAPVAAPSGASVGTGLRPAQGQTAQAQKNRESVFDADDAYGGI